MKSPLEQLHDYGQSIWLDNISRPLICDGGLASMRDQGLRGVTSNPTIFEKAIAAGEAYDAQLRGLLARTPGAPAAELVRELMVQDIRMAADVLAPVYERERGRDGFVSVEVTPSKARDTRATIEEVRQLRSLVDRDNVMIKIPATREGLPAIEQAIAEGCNINVTLIFSVERYREVAHAYLRGLERRAAEGKPLEHIASVASIFVSRVDTMVDDMIRTKIAGVKDSAAASRLTGLLGKAAVANAKMVYEAFKEIFLGSRGSTLALKGGAVQRPLWASTGTKNPAYSDLLYVETLVGAHTVNTVPPATYAAILDHSRPAPTVESDLAGARAVLRDLVAAGIDFGAVMNTLEEEGVAAFERSFEGLERNLESKRISLSSHIPA